MSIQSGVKGRKFSRGKRKGKNMKINMAKERQTGLVGRGKTGGDSLLTKGRHTD